MPHPRAAEKRPALNREAVTRDMTAEIVPQSQYLFPWGDGAGLVHDGKRYVNVSVEAIEFRPRQVGGLL